MPSYRHHDTQQNDSQDNDAITLCTTELQHPTCNTQHKMTLRITKEHEHLVSLCRVSLGSVLLSPFFSFPHAEVNIWQYCGQGNTIYQFPLRHPSSSMNNLINLV